MRLQLYLQNLSDVLNASAQSNAITANFNSALARLEEVKGTLLESEMVEVDGDGTNQLPPGLPAPQLQIPDSVLPAPAPSQTAPETAPPAPAPKPAPAKEPIPPAAKEPTPPAAKSDQGASIDPPKTVSARTFTSPGMVAKLAEAGRRAGQTLSPVGKRFAQPFHWPRAGRDSQIASDQTVQQPSKRDSDTGSNADYAC